jgi:predicted ATP-grasp superfamily ATP-dependent carboligase
MIVSNWIELRGALTTMLAKHGKVIARTAYGVAGDGSGVVRDEPGAVDAFLDNASRDSFFAFPILVQQFVEHADGIGCPAVDILVGEDGVEDVVLCSLTVANGYQFRSVDVGDGALPPVWGQRVTEVAHTLGNAAREYGYRGWMCADCVAGADDKLYVTEINARRSGSLHAGGLLRLWQAERTMTLCADFMMTVPPGITYEQHIRPIFQRLWDSGVRAYPTSMRGIYWDQPMMAVIAAAPTAKEAHEIVDGIRTAVNEAAHPQAVVVGT